MHDEGSSDGVPATHVGNPDGFLGWEPLQELGGTEPAEGSLFCLQKWGGLWVGWNETTQLLKVRKNML